MYPELPTAPPLEKKSENFRLQISCQMLEKIRKEERHYENLRKKYNRARTTSSAISVGTGVLAVGLSASGLGTSLSGLGIVIGIPLGVLSGILGISIHCFIKYIETTF